MSKLKVYGWTQHCPAAVRPALEARMRARHPGGRAHLAQVRAIMAATSKRQCVDVGDLGSGMLSEIAETANVRDVSTAMAHPGRILMRGIDDRARDTYLDAKTGDPVSMPYVLRDLSDDQRIALLATSRAAIGWSGAHADSIEQFVPNYVRSGWEGKPMPFGTRRLRKTLRELESMNLLVHCGREARYGLHAEGKAIVDEWKARSGA